MFNVENGLLVDMVGGATVGVDGIECARRVDARIVLNNFSSIFTDIARVSSNTPLGTVICTGNVDA